MADSLPANRASDADADDLAAGRGRGGRGSASRSSSRLTELVRELTDTPDDFASRDRIEIAVQQLARAGLLHRHGQFVLPTRALLRAIELDLG